MGLLYNEKIIAALDSNQSPVSKALLTVYAADSDMIVPLYAAPNLTVLQSNPLKADDEGRFPPCFTLDGLYRAEMRDPLGNALALNIPVIVSPCGSIGTVHDFADGATLRADQRMTYRPDTSGIHVKQGDSVRVAGTGFTYRVAPEEATSPHLTTAGGVNLWVQPDSSGRYYALAIGSGDIGADINTLFAYGGDDTHVYVGPGQHLMATTVNMDRSVGSHLVLEGAGHLITTLMLPAGASTIGIDMYDQDKSILRELRVKEDLGTRSCLAVLVGGTTARVSGVWAGNTKYGFVIGGANAHLNDWTCLGRVPGS